MKELLDTDRVNLLVWRYLLESNYRESAAKLQKEWRISQPHRDFDFARHVHHHALVSLLNKGLLYEAFQRDFAAQEGHQVSRDVPATAEARGVFGPLKYEHAQQDDNEDEEDDDESEAEPEHEELENSRKRPVDHQHHALPNGSPAKRQRLSNGYENGADSATTPMEIDHHADPNHHAYPSPLEGEQAASPLPRTEGPEQGTQVDKVRELTQETVFLRLGADEGADSSSEGSPARANENPIVLQCEWNPRDPSLLAAGGTDALARIWTISRGAAPDTLHGHVNDGLVVNGSRRPFKNMMDDSMPSSTQVSSMAWNNSGDALALAVETNGETDSKAHINIVSPDGVNLYRFTGNEPSVNKLRWSPDDSRVLAISPENGGTLIMIFMPNLESVISYNFAGHDLGNNFNLDAVWISDEEIVICGYTTLAAFKLEGSSLVRGREFPGKELLLPAELRSEKDGFTHIQYDVHSNTIAVAVSDGTIHLWEGSNPCRSISAHLGNLSALQWQPLQGEMSNGERLLASSGDDGAICIWNTMNPDNKPKYSMTMSLAVATIAMTPDGLFIAGATDERILIWKIGETSIPRASWSRVPHPGWQSPKSDDEETMIPCLGWDSEGQRLIYGINSRLAVINFR